MVFIWIWSICTKLISAVVAGVVLAPLPDASTAQHCCMCINRGRERVMRFCSRAGSEQLGHALVLLPFTAQRQHSWEAEESGWYLCASWNPLSKWKVILRWWWAVTVLSLLFTGSSLSFARLKSFMCVYSEIPLFPWCRSCTLFALKVLSCSQLIACFSH